MKLGSFIFPNDPYSLRVRYDRKVEIEQLEDGQWMAEIASHFLREFDGEGIFYGENAYEELKQLAQMLIGGLPQMLTHPKWGNAKVLLSQLEVLEECQNDFLRYQFRLVEAPPEDS